ncbi:MAG: hypothetical protein ACRCYY_11685 [Trueperaceae bacterium]
MPVVTLSKQDLITAYKKILREYLDQRPSGVRQKIAQVLGTHKSFVSLISNPNDQTPIPTRHVEAIMDVCHLSESERANFLLAYNIAHPDQLSTLDKPRHYKTLHIQVPVLQSPAKQEALELLLQDTVRRLYNLFANETTTPNEEKS